MQDHGPIGNYKSLLNASLWVSSRSEERDGGTDKEGRKWKSNRRGSDTQTRPGPSSLHEEAMTPRPGPSSLHEEAITPRPHEEAMTPRPHEEAITPRPGPSTWRGYDTQTTWRGYDTHDTKTRTLYMHSCFMETQLFKKPPHLHMLFPSHSETQHITQHDSSGGSLYHNNNKDRKSVV